eukprot:TRINITY_DN4913_c1_g1_i1.p2 TRINITY_DN4913_c1_g1~~TRINITY_DN4913_c1_g1_i1.p2  ORF type:complete len:139 (-),score=0.18 TRINITY_DN4913_c1_g1_i1:570-986(-)
MKRRVHFFFFPFFLLLKENEKNTQKTRNKKNKSKTNHKNQCGEHTAHTHAVCELSRWQAQHHRKNGTHAVKLQAHRQRHVCNHGSKGCVGAGQRQGVGGGGGGGGGGGMKDTRTSPAAWWMGGGKLPASLCASSLLVR